MSHVYGGLEGLTGGGLSLSRAFAPEPEYAPMGMLVIEAPDGDIFNVFCSWEAMLQLQRMLQETLEGQLPLPARLITYRNGAIVIASSEREGMTTITGTHWEDQRTASIMAEPARLWGLLGAIAAFLADNASTAPTGKS